MGVIQTDGSLLAIKVASVLYEFSEELLPEFTTNEDMSARISAYLTEVVGKPVKLTILDWPNRRFLTVVGAGSALNSGVSTHA